MSKRAWIVSLCGLFMMVAVGAAEETWLPDSTWSDPEEGTQYTTPSPTEVYDSSPLDPVYVPDAHEGFRDGLISETHQALWNAVDFFLAVHEWIRNAKGGWYHTGCCPRCRAESTDICQRPECSGPQASGPEYPTSSDPSVVIPSGEM